MERRGEMRLLRYSVLAVIVAFSLIFGGCSGNAAEELFKTAQFEELQRNEEHAAQLYEEIIKKYPDSEFARKSEERLSEISQ